MHAPRNSTTSISSSMPLENMKPSHPLMRIRGRENHTSRIIDLDVPVIKPKEKLRVKRMWILEKLVIIVVGLSFGSVLQAVYTDQMEMHRIHTIKMHPPVIDVLSIGSITRPEYLQAQARTFASLSAVRSFYPVTEINDTDATCSTTLTSAQYNATVDFCKSVDKRRSTPMYELMKSLFTPTSKGHNTTGWLCAQKRPVEAVARLVQQYHTEQRNFPEYLIVLDDDSYIANMEAVQHLLAADYPPETPAAVATFPYVFDEFMFPFGGYGAILTKAAMENLMHPIDCSIESTKHDRRSRLSCKQLELNMMGERRFFRNNMSVADLMYEYSAQQPYSTSNQWEEMGFCMHSDHTLAYFINSYLITLSKDNYLKHANKKKPVKTLHGYTTPKQQHWSINCTVSTPFCHYMKPEMMDSFFLERYGFHKPILMGPMQTLDW